MATKDQYENDPEGYWELKKDREDQKAQDILKDWERRNPNLPYGYRTPTYPE